MRLARSVVLLIALLAAALNAVATEETTDERPDAVPYRPTVSTPAQLSAPLWLEAELGGLYLHQPDDDGSLRRTGVPYALKFAFTDDWGVRLQGEAAVHANASDGSHATGVGDTAIIVKRRFEVDEASAFGLEAGPMFATARHGLEAGSGRTDWSVNAIYSADVDAWHGDINLVNTRLGRIDEGESRLQTLGALALSHPLVAQWSAAAELSAVRQHGAASTAQFLAALSYAVRRDLVVDFGAVRGLNRASPNWQAFSGVTIVLGRLD